MRESMRDMGTQKTTAAAIYRSWFSKYPPTSIKLQTTLLLKTNNIRAIWLHQGYDWKGSEQLLTTSHLHATRLS